MSSEGTNAINETAPAKHPDKYIFWKSVNEDLYLGLSKSLLQKPLAENIKALIGMLPITGDNDPLKKAESFPS